MRVLVLGGTGYIGASAVRKLVAHGETVVCFDQAIRGDQFADCGDKVTVVAGSVTRIEDVWTVIREHQIDRIINMAYVLGYPSEALPHLATSVNVLGMSNVFEVARLCGIKRVIFASSNAVFGPLEQFGDREVTAADYGVPDLLYGAQKALNEHLASSFNKNYGMEIAGLRITLIYGPGRERGFTTHNALITEPALGRPAKAPFSPDWRRSLIYVHDAAECLVRMVRADSLQHHVYLSGGHPVSMGELADLVRELIPGAQITLEDKLTNVAASPFRLDDRPVREELGFQLTPFRTTIEETIAESRRLAGIK